MVIMCRCNRILVMMALLAVVGNVYGTAWQVGEKWVYKHEGPRPFGDGSGVVKGDRTMEVTAVQGAGAEKRYLLKNLWGTEDPNPATSYVDPNHMIHKLNIENLGVMTIAPPVPGIWRLKIGEKKVVKTHLDFGGFIIAIEYVAQRLKDETLKVPAGEFKDCQHVQVISTIVSPMGEPTKNKTDAWYHPKVRNSVKDVIVTNYEGANSYTATSSLKSHATKD